MNAADSCDKIFALFEANIKIPPPNFILLLCNVVWSEVFNRIDLGIQIDLVTFI